MLFPVRQGCRVLLILRKGLSSTVVAQILTIDTQKLQRGQALAVIHMASGSDQLIQLRIAELI
jgi:hypothetical protein